MKALKYGGFKNSAVLAASLATTLGCLGINIASAQSSDTESAIKIDIETCQSLSDSTALDQESIKTRIACYSRDVEHLNLMVGQLMSERDELVADAESQSATIDEYKQELSNRQDAMQRLEERAVALRQQVDEVTADRNQVREQLFNMISEGKDQPIEVEANKRLFENFSQSYVSLTNKIEELRKRLQDFETANTELSDQQLATQIENQQLQSDQEELRKRLQDFEISNTELSDQQLATQIENQQLQSDQKELTAKITSLEESVAGLEAEKETLQADLTNANSELETIKSQLSANEKLAQQQLNDIDELKSSLAESEKQRIELEATVASLNKTHLDKITELNSQTESLNSEIEALNQQQLALQEASAKSDNELKSTITVRDEEIASLDAARKELNAEREALITQITALEKSHLEETQGYKEEAGVLEEQITALTTDKSDLDSQLQQQKSENDKLREYAAQSDTKNEELSIAATELREKLAAADTQAGDLQASIDELGQESATEKAKFTQQVAALNSTIEQNQQERASLAAELETIKPQLQTAEENLLNSEKQNEELAASVETLEQQLSKATEEQENLKSALLESKNQSMKANETLSSLKDNAETLTTLLAMSRTHSENADATLAELRTQMSEADNNLQAKQAELEALLAEKTRIENEFAAMAGKARKQAAAIEQSLQDAGHETVKVAVGEDNNIGILLGSGQLFRTGSARLSAEGRQVLSDLAAAFDLADDRRIMISGHSDNVPLGPKLSQLFKDNWGLSMARALATANFFADESGISADRMTVSGFGATQPIADNETPEGRQQNRRVEISLVPAEDTMASAE